MAGALVGILLIDALVFGLVAGAIWQSKGGSFGGGFLWGALLGILGLIYVAAAKPSPAGDSESATEAPPPKLAQAPTATSSPAAAPPPAAAKAPSARRECPFCREGMRRDASVCPHCRRESAAWEYRDGYWWTKDDEGQEVFLVEASGRWMRPGDRPPPPPTPPAPAVSWSRVRTAVRKGRRYDLGYLLDDRDNHYGVWERSSFKEVARFPLSDEGWERAFFEFWSLDTEEELGGLPRPGGTATPG